MRYLKTQVSIPLKALDKLKKEAQKQNDYLSVIAEEIASRYIDENLEPVPNKEKKIPMVLSLSYKFIKEVREKRKEKVKDFLSKALYQWIKESENDRN